MYPKNLKFGDTALKILHERYLWRDEDGNVIETPAQMLRRVAHAVAAPNPELEDAFYGMMASLDFLPNSPTLMNAGRKGIHGQLSACYVLDVPDSMEGIFEALKKQALVHKTGGGTGFNFSSLRPEGSSVRSTGGRASGPVSFMELFDTATEKVMQGGMRRGANMGILDCDHPDILAFIDAKAKDGKLPNFNLSVGITDDFMRSVRERTSPRNTAVWRHIVEQAHATGDPGVIFLDHINDHNTTPQLGPIRATNPCGETPLYGNEACVLGSVNLSNFWTGTHIDFQRLGKCVVLATIFLDNVIDVGKYPLPEIEAAVKNTRKIGLGIMGWADLLIKMGIPYNSTEALKLAVDLMGYITETARMVSLQRGHLLGSYAAIRPDATPCRNATVTCIAPTGTISMLAGCSSGIEPLFALEYERRAFAGGNEQVFKFKHPEYEKALSVPDDDRIERGVFVASHDICPEDHIRMQAAFQTQTDLAVSKTVNMPNDATVDDVEAAFILAWRLGCKGTTIYRDGSKSAQVLYHADSLHDSEGVESCPQCGGPVQHDGGCKHCVECGWGACSI